MNTTEIREGARVALREHWRKLHARGVSPETTGDVVWLKVGNTSVYRAPRGRRCRVGVTWTQPTDGARFFFVAPVSALRVVRS